MLSTAVQTSPLTFTTRGSTTTSQQFLTVFLKQIEKNLGIGSPRQICAATEGMRHKFWHLCGNDSDWRISHWLGKIYQRLLERREK